MTSHRAAPSREVLDAFACTGDPVRLHGGEGRAWRAGSVLLKPVDPGEGHVLAEWTADLFDGLKPDGFRIPRPVRAKSHRWIEGAWVGWRFIDGIEVETAAHWSDRLSALSAFHAAVAGVPRPQWMNRLSDPWSVADRVAWGEEQVQDLHPGLQGPMARLMRMRRQVDLPSQVVHGDIGGGNMLFVDGDLPAIIDMSPVWRPEPYARAAAAVDGMAWAGASVADLDLAGAGLPPEVFNQLCVRGCIRRLVTISEFCRTRGGGDLSDIPAWLPIISLLESRSSD